MAPLKACGLDGFPAFFYQRYWHVVGEDVTDFCLSILNGATDVEQLNQTQVILIPKVSNPETLAQFRPISLCNVLYKIVAKVLANRWAGMLDVCIGRSQGAFIPGRCITDNVIIAYERLITEPHCLLAQVLKARYYPRCDFLKAGLGSRPSYIWRSIWSVRGLIEKGYGWRVGSGEGINIWDDLWLPRPGDGRVRAAAIDVRYTTISDLIAQVDNSWKLEVLNDLFDAELVNQICSIPLSQTRSLDEIVWRCDGSGNYSVKSGYRVLCAEQVSTQVDGSSAFFSALWVINVPAKVKITMWRIVNNFIPTFQNMQIRRMQMTNVCPFCQSAGETVEHLMRDCGFVQQLMSRLNLPATSIQIAGPWKNWVVSYFAIPSDRYKRILVVLYWSVWYSRNKLIHEGTKPAIEKSASFIVAFIHEKDNLDRVLDGPGASCDSFWQAPPELVVKFNFDSAFSSRSATTGVVGRNSLGLLMASCSIQHKNVADAFMAEALACRQAVWFAKELGFSRVIIEGLSLTVIKKLNSDAVDRSLIYPIVHDIKALSRNFGSISFCFVRRGANKAAHALAHECCSFDGPCYWIEEAPVATMVECELDRSRLELV
ncbi:hypothetical protein GQ457_15G007970 [Hibiscus cannabinus]